LEAAALAADAEVFDLSLGEEGTSAGEMFATAADAEKKSDAMQRREQNKTLGKSRTCERELDDDINLFRREPAR
jgi:hypothetical protein